MAPFFFALFATGSGMPDDLSDAIEQNARGPARMRVGNEEGQAKNVNELIDADRYLKGQQSITRPGFGVGVQKIKPIYD